jgi:hypothetical protein
MELNKISLPPKYLKDLEQHGVKVDPQYKYFPGSLRETDAQIISEDFDSLIQSLKKADKAYAEIAEGTKLSVLGPRGIKNKRESPKHVLESFTSQLEDRKFPSALYSTVKTRQNEGLKKNFPESYQMLLDNKVSEIMEKSKRMIDGQERIDPTRLAKMFDPQFMDKKTAKELFGDDNMEKMKAIRFIIKNYPAIVNPSGTSAAQHQRAVGSLIGHISSLKRSVIYDAAQSPEKMARLAEKIASMLNSKTSKAAISQGIEARQDIDQIQIPQMIGDM